MATDFIVFVIVITTSHILVFHCCSYVIAGTFPPEFTQKRMHSYKKAHNAYKHVYVHIYNITITQNAD